MKPPYDPSATPPSNGSSEPWFNLVVDPDKLRVDVYRGTQADVHAEFGDLLAEGLYSRIDVIHRRWYNPNRWLPALAWLMLYSAPRSLTTFAALLAGRNHGSSRDEWLAHLGGEPGYQFGRWGQVRAALGFVLAAVRFRAEDAADLAWMPVDAVLRSRFLSGLFITGPVLAVVLVILHRDGRYGLVLDIQDPFCTGMCTWGTIFGLRKYRKVKPPDPKPRRAKE